MENVDEHEVRRAAFHEVVELMISPLRDIALDRCRDDSEEGEVHKECHRIVHRLSNTIWRDTMEQEDG